MKMVNYKLSSFDDAVRRREEAKANGEVVVLTNGCFDFLHVGHILSLESAKKFGDQLWVALNSDDSIKMIKGDNRPILMAEERAYMLAALECVDGVFLFDGITLAEELNLFRPDVYVKSSDYSIDTLNEDEKAVLIDIGAKIEFTEYLDGISTTKIIDRIKKSYQT
ncbi:MAG: adenylyltransferase/cytidyltransferase family protein [Puniceicoccales bacterium]|jgi:D-beta-D-heptose 7-phosphate kinase/D-beta-D-heptose 1-phosphate adenosyltransferase|nr:adenylyltransferase/cytidyltransferase family protein [Puniceicoccales bacterium]